MIHSEELEAPDFSYLIHRITALTAQYRHISNIYVDASAPAVISSVKKLLHDFPADNYLEHIANLEKQYKTTIAVERFVRVLPVSFGQHGKDMLAKVKLILDDSRGICAISPKFERLIVCLRGAVASRIISSSPRAHTMTAWIA